MKVKILSFVFLALFLCSCGRQHPGRILNDTDETLLVTIKLNYPFTEYCPDNYFYKKIAQNNDVRTEGIKTATDFTISFDSIKNIAILKLLPNDEINLGTVRLGGGNRNDYRSWEFTEITCKGSKGYTMHAKDEQLMDYVNKRYYLFSNYTHSFTIK